MTLHQQTAAIHNLLEVRGNMRAVAEDYRDALQTARAAGLSNHRIADELMRDSVAHNEVMPMAALLRDIIGPLTTPDEREPAPCWP
jgi:ribosome-binding protein aMBF1 (putative translation factor)